MLSAQYLASFLRSDHPAHEPVKRRARRRNMKQTFQSRHHDDVSPFLVNGSLPAGAFSESKKAIHTKYVENSITAQGNHPLIGIPPPVIDKSEQNLPRRHRSTLGTGQCNSLQGYKHRVGRSDTPSCPQCDESVHHIFNCQSSQTNFSVIDLWRQPVRVAEYLSSHPSFDLAPPPPPLARPALRPPPEPPP